MKKLLLIAPLLVFSAACFAQAVKLSPEEAAEMRRLDKWQDGLCARMKLTEGGQEFYTRLSDAADNLCSEANPKDEKARKACQQWVANRVKEYLCYAIVFQNISPDSKEQ